MKIGHLYGFAKEKTVFKIPDPQQLLRITNYFSFVTIMPHIKNYV